ncbi:hypothetical protein B9G55_19815 [Saccharibacillus sp. O16]|nr:hypothetical protein B9G55_19815 [Saccharibacillus sp. O16]
MKNNRSSRTKKQETLPDTPQEKRGLHRLLRLPFFRFWMPIGLLLIALASVPNLYSSLPGVSLQGGILTVTTIRACLNWLVSIGSFLFIVTLLIRKRKEFFKQYPLFLYLVCWFGAFCLPGALLAWFDTPNVSYDLARYYVQGTIDERHISISSVQEICSSGRTTVCTLWIDTEDGERYSTRGTLANVIKEHGDIEAIRVLPRSGRLVGVRTKDGWV